MITKLPEIISNDFGRERGLELISRFEFDFRRCGFSTLSEFDFRRCGKFFVMIRIFGVVGVQSHAINVAVHVQCAVACLHPDNSIPNVFVSVTIHDNMYMYICTCTDVYMYIYVYGVYVCICVFVCCVLFVVACSCV